MKKLIFVCFIFVLLLIFLTELSAASYFVLPVASNIPISAYYDLNRTSGNISDWTGWTGTTWVYGHAYDQHKGTDYVP